MQIKLLNNFRGLKEGQNITIKPNALNRWMGFNGSGKSTAASMLLTHFNKIDNAVPAEVWNGLLIDTTAYEITGGSKITKVSYYSDRIRQSQSVDIGIAIATGLGRLQSSEGQNAQQDVHDAFKHRNDKHRLFIFDEVDGRLDQRHKIIFYDYILPKLKGTVIIISHDLLFNTKHEILDFSDFKVKTVTQYAKEAEDWVNNAKKQII